MIAATAIPTLLNSIRPDDDRSDLSGNSLTVVGASMPRSIKTRFTVSSVRSGGVLKKWTIFDGGCILFLLAIAGFKNLQQVRMPDLVKYQISDLVLPACNRLNHFYFRNAISVNRGCFNFFINCTFQYLLRCTS